MERFECRTQVICGEGVLGAALEGIGKRLAVVTEPFRSRDGPARRFLEGLKERKLLVLEDVAPEPTMHQAVQGARKLREFGPDTVIALGDAGVMDCAKAMVCFSRLNCSLTVIPTDIGSGAEITDRVVLTHERQRHLFRDETMRPHRAVLDAELLGEQPKGIIREGGFLLLANSLEAYTGRQTGMLTDIHAREAFSATWAALPASLSGCSGARRRVMTAAVLGGLAVDGAGLGLCAALGSSLGSVFHLPAGRLAGILLPPVISCNAHAAGRKYAELARSAGMGGGNESAGVRNLKTGLLRLRRELGLPETLAQAGIDPRTLWSHAGRIVGMTLEHPDCRNNPLTADDYLVRRILEEITGHF